MNTRVSTWSKRRKSKGQQSASKSTEQPDQATQLLQAEVEELSAAYFGRPFTHQARYNKRLKTTGGRYHLSDHHLDFHQALADRPADRRGVILHELCHYHLHLTGQGYQHRDLAFKKVLAAVGAPRYAPDFGAGQQAHYWHYRCQQGHDIYRKRRFQTDRFRCGRCRSKLFLVTEK
ncbi:SprT family protein [Leuconostocaceae bacterium ESL0958]|nr:SprT family protein [Leuconostocaceae bacterium ESL0958]